jgi:hypothetical protein
VAFLHPGGKRPGTCEVDNLTRIGREPSPHTIDGTKPQIRPNCRTQ